MSTVGIRHCISIPSLEVDNYSMNTVIIVSRQLPCYELITNHRYVRKYNTCRSGQAWKLNYVANVVVSITPLLE